MIIICNKCGLQLRPKKIGVPVIFMFMDPPEPYKIRESDELECPGCGLTVLAGLPQSGDEHFEPTFSASLKNAKKRGGVKVYEHPGDKGKYDR